MKKISIVIPCYGTEQYIERCLDSIINQTYKNLQVVVVNDCSKGNMLEILNEYAKKDNRIKVISNEENQGLYKTRIIGSKECDGDYITFVDSDDYVDIDYYRSLMESIETNDSQIAIAAPVIDNKNGRFIFNLMLETQNKLLTGKEIMDNYFAQEGQNYRWHIVCDKLIDMNVWKKALPHYEKLKSRIAMTEDFLFSTIAMYYASRVSFCDNAYYFYCENATSMTSTNNIEPEKVKRNINDILVSYGFVKKFLKKQQIIEKYSDNINNWECLYLNMHLKLLSDVDKKQVIELIDKEVDYSERIKTMDLSTYENYYLSYSDYNDGLNKIKKAICNPTIKVVSFDLFDTLVVRPFYNPSDLFQLMNKEFIEKTRGNFVTKFSKIRVEAESQVRIINEEKGIEEVTIQEIYDYIRKTYDISKKIIDYFISKEKELELKFCQQRKTAYGLYKLAKLMGKKVIVTTDIYLDKDTINKILSNNNYKFDSVYVSSEIKKTKNTGELYNYIIEKEKIESHEMLHIGDNYHSDYEKAKEKQVETCHFPRTINTMMDIEHCGSLYKYFNMFNIDVRPYLLNFGVRCSIALVANKFFDNPFVSFCKNSAFSSNPFLLGYYGLGMNLLAISNWLLKDMKKNNVDKISFMARDGFLPLKASQIMQKNTNINKITKLDYIYVSRRALTPLIFDSKTSLNMLDTYLTSYTRMTPQDLLKQMKVVLKDKKDSQYIDFIRENGYNENEFFASKNSFMNLVYLLYDKYYDKNKYLEYYNTVKDYFEEFLTSKSAVFDIGYSGKPEALISQIVGFPIKTYFVHANSSEAYDNAYISNFELNTFYDYKPTLTGTIRELLYSDINPSCIGYMKQNGVSKPIFGSKEKYTYYNVEMINIIQKSAIEFVDDFTSTFGDYYDQIDLNKFYLTIPYEYYLHYLNYYDKNLMKSLIFSDNVNNDVELLEFIESEFNNYKTYYNLAEIDKQLNMDEALRILQDQGYGRLPKFRLTRMGYYLLFDRKAMKEKYTKWKNKKNNPLTLPNSKVKRALYYMVFDRKKLIDVFKK